ncbi:HK97 gp10 family phage protein [Acinetobacter johnsonii]|jgi:hypothetical protein|uniref:HK97 gp10 family phage protein n=1 Tax=Acinetobacter johnsonii TaxID=40214 RepID=UPI00244B89CF|nr:HK97 gp10 family phage protein [Acinetobacter johnsonii]MDH2045659.1 HK97 gp10 family phage protein [Acinetobacter johnsonii]
MGLKKGNINNIQRRLAKLSEMPVTMDRELRNLALEMGEVATHMSPILTGRLRNNIRYSRVGSERNAKGQFVKGGLGIHTISLVYSQDYFSRVHNEMAVGRTGQKYQPSEKSMEAAAAGGEIAGGLFMHRAMQKYQPIIAARLAQVAKKFIQIHY